MPPVVRCSWPAPSSGSETLVVADLDGDHRPEVLVPIDRPAGILALHGADCSQLFFAPVDFSPPGELAVGDLDGDGVPEIVAVNTKGYVIVLDSRGDLLATASDYLSWQNGPAYWAPLSIADVDGASPSEIVEGSLVLRYHKGSSKLETVWNRPLTGQPIAGSESSVADLDGDGVLEVVVNAMILDGATGNDKTPMLLAQMLPSVPLGAYSALGDFNADHHADIVFTQDYMGVERVAVFDYKNSRFLLGPMDTGELGGGPPTVADVDGDGLPEFATASKDHLTVYSLKRNGILWQKKTRDHSSWSTTASAFDFNGDGAYDLAYRDECFLRVYDGPTGKTLSAIAVTSNTALELPTIADLDGDGHAELIIGSDDPKELGVPDWCFHEADPDTGTPWTGNTRSVFVFQDPLHRWMPARPVWNEHAYHGTNVGNDLSIPPHEAPSWSASNTWRAQPSMFKVRSLPDFTAGVASGIDVSSKNCSTSWTLTADLCNRGATAAPAPVPGTFYGSDPRQKMASVLCSTATTAPLAPGECEAVSCSWDHPPMGAMTLWFRADDDGSKSPIEECRPSNDLLSLPDISCRNIQ